MQKGASVCLKNLTASNAGDVRSRLGGARHAGLGLNAEALHPGAAFLTATTHTRGHDGEQVVDGSTTASRIEKHLGAISTPY